MTDSPSTLGSSAPTTQNQWLELAQRPPWAEVSVLLLALIVRVWRLSYHSIWFDESVSLKWASSDPSYIWSVTFPLLQDKHPPLYYLLLHTWRQLLAPLGLASSDAALRLSGSILGVFTVAGVMLLAGRLATRRTGLLAGALVALSPVLVWYSQELRMFQPATTAIVWAACALYLAWEADNHLKRYLFWLLLILSLTAALYTYLFSAFILPAAGLSVLLLARVRRSWRFLIEGMIALTVATAIFLPLASNAWLVNANESTPGVAFENLFANSFRLIRVFSVWRVPWSEPVVAVSTTLFAVFAVVGLVLPRTEGDSSYRVGPLDLDQLWLVLWLGTPLLTANLMLSRSGSIFDEDRYLLFLAPFFLWAVARGVDSLSSRSRILGWASGIAVVTPLMFAIPILWTPGMARENWRAAADYIAEYSVESPGLPDAVIAHVDYTREALEWYLRQHTQADVPVFFPFGGALTEEDIETVIAPPLLGLIDLGAHTAWLTQSHLDGVDDQRLVEHWFASNYPIVTELYPAGVKVSGYMLKHRYKELPELNERAVYPNVEVVPGITLVACEVLPESVEARDSTLHPPSGWVHVRLWWQADGVSGDASSDDAPIDYETVAQVTGPEGIWGDRLYRDGEALDRWPTSQWLRGEIAREELDINLNPLTPSGEYSVVVGMKDPQTREAPNTVSCGTIPIR